MADRRSRPKPSRSDRELRRLYDALRRDFEQHKADSEKAVKAILEQLARIPGARGSMPPPKN